MCILAHLAPAAARAPGGPRGRPRGGGRLRRGVGRDGRPVAGHRRDVLVGALLVGLRPRRSPRRPRAGGRPRGSAEVLPIEIPTILDPRSARFFEKIPTASGSDRTACLARVPERGVGPQSLNQGRGGERRGGRETKRGIRWKGGNEEREVREGGE